MGACEEKATKEYIRAIEEIDADAASSVDELLSIFKVTQGERDRIDSLISEGENLHEDIRGAALIGGKGVFSRIFQGIGSNLVNSDSMAMRGLAAKLFEMPQGGASRAEGTAAVDQMIFKRSILSAMGGRHNEALIEYYKEVGKNHFAPWNLNIDTEFKAKVFQEVTNPGTHTSPAVLKSAEGFRDMFEVAGGLQKQEGVAGFEDLKPRANRDYMPKVINHGTLMNTIAKMEKLHGKGNGRKFVEEWLTKAYMGSKTFKLDQRSATIVAKAQIARAGDKTLTMLGASRTVKNSDIEAMGDMLRKQGLSEEEVSAFLNTATEHETRTHISDRAKRSFDPDLTVEHAGIKASDIFETDVEKLGEAYAREAAGNAAIARQGFKTKNQLQDTLHTLEKHMRGVGMNEKRVKQEVDMVKGGVDMLFGRVVDADNVKDTWIRAAGAARAWTALLRLTKVGLASFPESARSLADRGTRITRESMPSARELFDSARSYREGESFGGKYKDPVFEETDFIFRYLGDDQLLDFRGVAVDSLEESANTGWGKMFEKIAAQGQYYQSYFSTFRAIQGGGEKLAGRSLINAMKGQALGKTNGILKEVEIKEAGWHDGWYEKFLAWGKDNQKDIEFNGKKTSVFDWEKLPPEDLHKLRQGMYRIIKRKMQAQFVGETSLWMNSFFGKFLSQFRSFQIASLEKQLIRDVKFDKAGGSVALLASLAMGEAMHIAQSYSTALGREDSDKFMKEAMSPMGMALGTLNRSGQLAAFGIGIDALETVGLMPDMMGKVGTSYGARGFSPASIPVVGVAMDLKKAVNIPSSLVSGDTTPGQAMNKIQKLVPPLQILGVQNAWNYLERKIDE